MGALWGCLATGPPLTAQTATEGDPPAENFFDVVDVEIVNIDVWVTDKKGNPVDRLGRDDFIVYRDNRPTEVTNFYAVSGGRPVPEGTGESAGSEPASPAGPNRVPTGLPPLPEELEVAPEHRLWLIVYIDNYNLDPIERNRVLPALRRFLNRTLDPGDQAMVVTYSRSLDVHQPFTNQIPLLLSSLDELKDDAGHAVVRRRDQMAALARIDKARDRSTAMFYARQYAEEQMNNVQYTVGALERLIHSLAGLPGRKALVHVSSGVPMLAGEEMFHAVAEKFNSSEPYGSIPRHDTTRSFEKINRHANANRVSFYTVDAGGLRGIEFGSAEYAGFVDPRLRMTLDSVVPENLQSPLRFMALETGGQAILNQNTVLPALEKAAQGFRSFYSLGIASSDGDSGRYHEIEVKLREGHKGLRLRHRGGYRSKTTDARVRESLQSALLYSHQANPGRVKVVWGRPQPEGEDGHYLLPINLHIPLQPLVVLPVGPDRHEVRLRLFVGAVGEDGGTSEIDAVPFGLRLANEHVEAARKESLVYTHKLLLSRGRRKVGVAVLDVFGRESSVVTRFVQVGPPRPE